MFASRRIVVLILTINLCLPQTYGLCEDMPIANAINEKQPAVAINKQANPDLAKHLEKEQVVPQNRAEIGAVLQLANNPIVEDAADQEKHVVLFNPAVLPKGLEIEAKNIEAFLNNTKIAGLNEKNKAEIIHNIQLFGPKTFEWTRNENENIFLFKKDNNTFLIQLNFGGNLAFSIQSPVGLENIKKGVIAGGAEIAAAGNAQVSPAGEIKLNTATTIENAVQGNGECPGPSCARPEEPHKKVGALEEIAVIVPQAPPPPEVGPNGLPDIVYDEAIALAAKKVPERRMETFRPEDAELACLPGSDCARRKRAKG